ncbi:MAG: alpha/beta hydrolase-fold protein [Fimbriimonadaceae bacterium]|nr:alpha/beta hydrolase-fold protein [Fimbriimonadaceae bacterium]
MLSAVMATLVMGQGPERRTSITGEVRIHAGFASQTLRNRRRISVYLPPGYDRSKSRYRVLYMHDGQNVFDGMTSYIPNAEWRADETAQALIESRLIEPLIIVGIDNAAADRANEFLPTRRGEMGGKASQYGDFVVKEVMPFINRTYRTSIRREDTAIAGSSFGAVISLCIARQYPEVFGSVAACSPSVWWDDRIMLQRVANWPKSPRPRIWIDAGTKEGPQMEVDARDLASAFERQGWRRGLDLALYIDRDAEHTESAWARRFGEILMWFNRRPGR